MRDAELRFATLRMRIVERSTTTRGEDAVQMDVLLRHPGHAKVTTSRPGRVLGGDYEVWISDGDLVRTYAAAHKLGTQRPIRNRPRGLEDRDLPGMSRVYEPVTALPMETLPDTFVHPGGYCQNVLATGRCTVTGTGLINDREAILLECDHPRTIEVSGGSTRLPYLDRGRSPARDHRPARGIDRRGDDTRRRGHRTRAGRTAPAGGVRLRLPDRDDDALLTGRPSRGVRGRV